MVVWYLSTVPITVTGADTTYTVGMVSIQQKIILCTVISASFFIPVSLIRVTVRRSAFDTNVPDKVLDKYIMFLCKKLCLVLAELLTCK